MKILPIYKGRKIDSDEYIEGFYSQGVSRNKATRFETTHIIKLKEVDPSTLEISFDNGQSWRSAYGIEMIQPWKNGKHNKTTTKILKQCGCHSYNKDDGEVENIILDPKDYFKNDSSFTKKVCIDACIAEQIKMLWKNGIWTGGCCCGHGKGKPNIIVEHSQDAKPAKKLLKKYDKEREWNVLYYELLII